MVNSSDKKLKVLLFMAAYSFFTIIKLARHFVTSARHAAQGMGTFLQDSAEGVMMSRISRVSVIFLAMVCCVLVLAMGRKKFEWGRAASSFVYGIIAYALWGIFITASGLAFFRDSGIYAPMLANYAFFATLIMSVRIISVYNLRRKVLGVTVFALGTTLLGAYITHFNGLEFLDGLSGIFMAHGRYREAFGLGHYNTVGRLCLYYFIFTALYRTTLSEHQRQHSNLRKGGGQESSSLMLCMYT